MTQMTHHTAPSPFAWTLGDRLAKSRRVAGLTQQQMADRLLTSRQTINSWESGAHRPSARKVKAWALATGAPPEWLVSGVTTTTGWYQRAAAQQSHTEHARMSAQQRYHLLNGARNGGEAKILRFPVAV